MKLILNATVLVIFGTLLSSCEVYERIEAKSAKINQYERASYELARANRNLKSEISRLKFEIQRIKSEKNYLEIQLGKVTSPKKSVQVQRKIASVPTQKIKNDLVNYDTYKWTPSQVISMAEKEFEQKNFEKSAQFFLTFKNKFPGHKRINDKFLFQAGVASYESGTHPQWTLDHLSKLVKEYPTSPFYRGAKLWMALTHLQLGDNDEFFATVEEFRKKYRNTEEWKVLSQHYEKIVQKYKRN